MKKNIEPEEAAREKGKQKPSVDKKEIGEKEQEKRNQEEKDTEADEEEHVLLNMRAVPRSQDKRKMVPRKSKTCSHRFQPKAPHSTWFTYI